MAWLIFQPGKCGQKSAGFDMPFQLTDCNILAGFLNLQMDKILLARNKNIPKTGIMRFARNIKVAKNGQKPFCLSTKISKKRAKRVLPVASFFELYKFKNSLYLL
ncbi:MAG: hypothetical protein ACTHMI_07525 [Mucilaginibacter sp.]